MKASPAPIDRGRRRGGPAPSYTTGRAGYNIGGSSSKPQPAPSRADALQAQGFPLPAVQGSADWWRTRHAPGSLSTPGPALGVLMGAPQHHQVLPSPSGASTRSNAPAESATEPVGLHPSTSVRIRAISSTPS